MVQRVQEQKCMHPLADTRQAPSINSHTGSFWSENDVRGKVRGAQSALPSKMLSRGVIEGSRRCTWLDIHRVAQPSVQKTEACYRQVDRWSMGPIYAIATLWGRELMAGRKASPGLMRAS